MSKSLLEPQRYHKNFLKAADVHILRPICTTNNTKGYRKPIKKSVVFSDLEFGYCTFECEVITSSDREWRLRNAPVATSPPFASHSTSGRGLHKAEDHLLARERDPQGNDHRVVRERLPIHDEGDDVVALEATLAQLAEPPNARPDEPARDGRGSQAEGRRDGLRALGVGATAQVPEHLQEHPAIGLPGVLEALVGAEQDLPVTREIPDTRVGDRELLIQQVHRPALVPPADGTQRAPLILVELDGANGPQPLQQVLLHLLAELKMLRDRVNAMYPRA